MSPLASTPEPPYYAAIFSSTLGGDDSEYESAAAHMLERAARQPGYLGVETSGRDGIGITVSYWESAEAIAGWRDDVEHRVVRKAGRTRWYTAYELRIARVERAVSWARVDV